MSRYNRCAMGRWIVIALCSVWASAAFAQAGDADGPASTSDYQELNELVSAAERHSPGVRAARHSIAAATSLLREVKGSPFFQFDATGLLGIAPDVRGTPLYSPANNQAGFGSGGWNVATGAQVSGVIPLYTWGKLKEARHAAEAGVDAAEGNRERALAQLRYEVRRAYFGLQFALDVLQLISEGKGKLEKALERLRERLEDGAEDAREEDVWRLSATLSEIEAGEAEARQLETSARAALAVLSGISDVEVAECPTARVDYDLRPLAFYHDAARLNRPEGHMLDSAVRARKSAVKVASSRYFPDLGLVLGLGRTWTPGRTDQLNPFASDNGNRTNVTAGLAARWSLDFWGTHFKVARAEAELDATSALREQAHGGMELEVTAAYEQVRATQATEQAWERGQRDTRSWFLAATQAYQVGANEPKDVVDAVKAYFKARGAHLETVREHNIGLAALERVAGVKLLPDAKGWEPKCE